MKAILGNICKKGSHSFLFLFLNVIRISLILCCTAVLIWAQSTPKLGSVMTWGKNDSGQLGYPDPGGKYSSSPDYALSLDSVIKLSAGASHTLALKSDGTLWAWGYNAAGQLGNNTFDDHAVPTIMLKTEAMSQSPKVVSAGYYHSLVLLQDGTVFACGSNDYGQLGDNTKKSQPVFVQVTGLQDVVAIAGGSYHSVALKKDGTVWGWGRNYNGQLGNGDFADRLTPAQTVNLTDVVAISAGQYHSLALKKDGTVWSWGYNSSGQLGYGGITPAKTSTPAQVSSLPAIVAIAAGALHSLALDSSGNVWAWGASSKGQLGRDLSATPLPPAPAIVRVARDIKSIAAGGYHNLALTADGALLAWGLNGDGQLGIGNTADQPYPVAVMPKAADIVAISAGVSHSAAVIGVAEAPSDSTPPVTVATISPTPAPSGWNNSNVTVTLNASDNEGGTGVQDVRYTLQGAQTLSTQIVPGDVVQCLISTEGITAVYFAATDKSGNAETEKSMMVMLDKTPPLVSYSGNAGTYSIDQQVKITCSATDFLSGIESSTCKDIQGPALSFVLGENQFSASAMDKAGNVGAGSVRFTVKVSYDGLMALTLQMVSKEGISKSLCAKLDAAKAAEKRGNLTAKAGSLNAYANEVQAQTGKTLSAEQAALLLRLAAAL